MSTLTRRTLPTVLAAMSARALVQDTEPLRPNLGAIWFDTTAGALKVWDGTSWEVAEVDTSGIAAGAVDDTKIADGTISEGKLSFVLPDGKTTVTVDATAPTSPNVDDLWIDTSSGSVLKRWDGSAWVVYQFGVGAVSFDARDLGGVTTTIDTVAPTSPIIGDLWYDSANGYKLNQWDGSAWVAYQFGTDALADNSITAGKVSFTARNIGGITTTFAASAPTGAVAGDLWYDSSSDYQLNQYNGTAWVAFQFGTAAIADGSIDDAKVSFVARDIGGVTTFTQSATPTGAVAGDLWIDTGNGNVLKRYDGTSWTSFQDAAIATAQSAADTADAAAATAQSAADAAQTAADAAQSSADDAQTTADGKNRIFRQGTTPTADATGDVWFDTANGNRVSVWDGTTWVTSQLQGVAVGNLDAGSITTGTLSASRIAADSIDGSKIAADAISASEIAAGAVSTSELAALAVTAAKIAANTITAGQIAAGTITATEIAADTITASQIAAGAITSSEIAANAVTTTALNAGSVTTAKVAANAITAALIAADTITAAQIAAGAITTTELAANAVTAAKIAANTITAAQIAANTITASQIAAGTITATELAANSVTASQIAANAVTAAKLAAGIVYAGIVDATTITGAQIVATGTAGEVLVYDGTPTAGNLILAVSGQAGSDSFGNQYVQGLTLSADSLHSGKLNFLDAGIGSVAAHIETLSTGTVGNDTMIINSQGKLTLSARADAGINICPPGTIQMYGGSAAPNTDWLLCDGSSVLRATYPSLFAAIGTTYGSVDATHFTLPDFGSKFPRGNTPGTGGGADTHTHPLSDNGQAQINIAGGTKTNVREVTTASFNATDGVNGTSTSAGNSQVRGAALRGDTDSASNVPAYTGVNFIIKT